MGPVAPFDVAAGPVAPVAPFTAFTPGAPRGPVLPLGALPYPPSSIKTSYNPAIPPKRYSLRDTGIPISDPAYTRYTVLRIRITVTGFWEASSTSTIMPAEVLLYCFVSPASFPMI